MEKTLTLGKTEAKRRRGWQRKTWLDSVTASTDMNLTKLWKAGEDRAAWYAAARRLTKSRTQPNRTTT